MRKLVAYTLLSADGVAESPDQFLVDFDDELPRSPTGKLYKRLLRDRYWAGHASPLV